MSTTPNASSPVGRAASPTDPRVFILRPADLDRGDLGLAGGKGTNLGELIRAGFPVPDGFVLGTAAYDYHLARRGLAETFSQHLRAPEPSGEALRSAIEAAAIPEDLERAILTACCRSVGSAGM